MPEFIGFRGAFGRRVAGMWLCLQAAQKLSAIAQAVGEGVSLLTLSRKREGGKSALHLLSRSAWECKK